MSDNAYLIRDAIVGNPTADEKRAAIAALGDLIRDLAEARVERLGALRQGDVLVLRLTQRMDPALIHETTERLRFYLDPFGVGAVVIGEGVEVATAPTGGGQPT